MKFSIKTIKKYTYTLPDRFGQSLILVMFLAIAATLTRSIMVDSAPLLGRAIFLVLIGFALYLAGLMLHLITMSAELTTEAIRIRSIFGLRVYSFSIIQEVVFPIEYRGSKTTKLVIAGKRKHLTIPDQMREDLKKAVNENK